MKINTFICILITAFFNAAFAHEIALTFDDLPDQQDHSAAQQRDINLAILNALDKYNAPAIGFVNESKLYLSGETDKKIGVLKLWIDHGQQLGNHTYSHVSMHAVSLNEYKQDVLKGASTIEDVKYFRHPYLHTGTSPEARSDFNAFLKQNGYVIAPVTFDTDDYVFNTELINHPENKDHIISAYLEHTREKFNFYKDATDKMFGRNIKHIWLLHANQLNAYVMNDLLKIAKENGYTFITLDDALKDPAYTSIDHYYKDYGVSWLYRWDYSGNKVVDWKNEPEPDL